MSATLRRRCAAAGHVHSHSRCRRAVVLVPVSWPPRLTRSRSTTTACRPHGSVLVRPSGIVGSSYSHVLKSLAAVARRLRTVSSPERSSAAGAVPFLERPISGTSDALAGTYVFWASCRTTSSRPESACPGLRIRSGARPEVRAQQRDFTITINPGSGSSRTRIPQLPGRSALPYSTTLQAQLMTGPIRPRAAHRARLTGR